MRFKKILTVALISCSLLAPSLFSNDTTVTIAGESITYEITEDISMDSEVLKITDNHINIEYEFTNHSQKDIEVEVAFPLPPSPETLFDTASIFCNWDDLYFAHRFIDDMNSNNNPRSLRNELHHDAAFTDFKRTYNGDNYGFDTIVKAIDKNGNDITDLLKKHKIPLSSMYLGGFQEEGAARKEPDIKKKLSDLNLLNERDLPIWQTHIIYHWKQKFPAEKTINVTHSYTPHTGIHWLRFKKDSNTPLSDVEIYHRDKEDKKITDYTISDEDKAAFLSLADPDMAEKAGGNISEDVISHQIQEVRYVLTTGAHWKGRKIQSFRLEITPPTKNTIVLAAFDGKLEKKSDGTYQCEIKNFEPTKDISILFIKVGPDIPTQDSALN